MTWIHRAGCDRHTCYCVDETGDPICDCGYPAFACCCETIERQRREIEEEQEMDMRERAREGNGGA